VCQQETFAGNVEVIDSFATPSCAWAKRNGPEGPSNLRSLHETPASCQRLALVALATGLLFATGFFGVDFLAIW